MKNKVLITGAAGFIGFHLSRLLADKGYTITGIDNINDYYDVRLKYLRLAELGIAEKEIAYGKRVHGTIDFIRMDIADKDAVMELFEKERFHYVVNLAAQAGVRYSLVNPQAYVDSNVTGFLNILEACRKYPPLHLVFASSSSVYGLSKEIPFSTSSHTDHPISIYAATKKADEMMAHSYAHLYGIPSTGLRFFTVYGPWGRPDMALHIFAKAIYEERTFDVYNYGDMSRDFTYIDDITESIRRLLILPPASGNPAFDPTHPDPSISSAPYRIFNIGNNNPVQLMDFVRAIEKSLGKKANINFTGMQPGDVQATYADVQSLYDYIDFKPATDIETGIAKFIEKFKELYGLLHD